MRIGELSKKSGVPVETIRFYEAKGLLSPPTRTASNYREYEASHLARLHFVRHCRLLGMGLDDVLELVACGDGEANHLHDLIDRHVETVSARIADLVRLREKLLELKTKCDGTHEDGHRCAILDMLESYDKNDHDCCDHFHVQCASEGKKGE